MYENRICRLYRDGKVTKEQLDACSTCDLNAAARSGLSEESLRQLSGRSGESIVREDIARQMKQREGSD